MIKYQYNKLLGDKLLPADIVLAPEWWIFALAGITALLIALITVSVQSWKASNRNPVEALRYE